MKDEATSRRMKLLRFAVGFQARAKFVLLAYRAVGERQFTPNQHCGSSTDGTQIKHGWRKRIPSVFHPCSSVADCS
jgi:hypothetical protein